VFLTTKNRRILEHLKLVPYNNTVLSEQDQDNLIKYEQYGTKCIIR